MPREPSIPEEQTILGRFVTDHFDAPLLLSCSPYLPQLLEIHSRSEPRSLIRQALSSAAEMNFGFRHNVPDLKDRAANGYVSFLNCLRNSLKDPRQARSNELIAAVYLAGKYEV